MNFSNQSSPLKFEELQPKGKGLAPYATKYNPLLKLSITKRLILGFFIPACIAALAAGLVGFQSSQLLSQESSFYHSLFGTYENLTSGESYLQLMDSKLHSTLNDAATPNVAHDTLTSDQAAIESLTTRYDNILVDYTQHDLLDQHPDQVALFAEAGHTGQTSQQRTLVESTTLTWHVYRKAQDQILQNILNGDLTTAQKEERVQGEPTQADALSALHTLIQFDAGLGASVNDATTIEQNHLLITTLVAALLVFLAIGIIGWLIAYTLIPRLQKLRNVAQSVEKGRMQTRVAADGQDEITDVSLSVNTMLDTIVGLLEETQHQRDALIHATERLFADLRMAAGDELRINEAANNDPIGMLGNAFNFTIGRFRRFVLRTQTSIEQLEVISRQEIEHAHNFIQTTQQLLQDSSASPALSSTRNDRHSNRPSKEIQNGKSEFVLRIRQAQESLQQLASENDRRQELDTLVNVTEQIYHICQQMTQSARATSATTNPALSQLRILEAALTQLNRSLGDLPTSTKQNFSRLDAMLQQLLSMASTAEPSSIASTSLTNVQIQEFTRVADSFAQTVADLAQRLTRITQETRTSLVPFQLEAPSTTASAGR